MREDSATELTSSDISGLRVKAALLLKCPFCHADPGQACRSHRGLGHEVDWPHSRRLALLHPPKQAIRRQALCCECGEIRTVSVDHHKAADPNRSGGIFRDPRGWYDTITLKCSNCGKQTRHAKTGPGRYDSGRDFVEDYQRYVLTGAWEGDVEPDRERLQAEYFAQFPRNPKLRHRYLFADAEKHRQAGDARMKGLCGADMDVPPAATDKIADRTPVGALHKPDRIDWDTEFEDPQTGMWWVDMQCVDCMRVSNSLRRAQRWEKLKLLLEWFTYRSEALDDESTELLLEVLETLKRKPDEGVIRKNGRHDCT